MSTADALIEIAQLENQITFEKKKVAAALATADAAVINANEFLRPERGERLAGLRELERMFPKRESALRHRIAELQVRVENQTKP